MPQGTGSTFTICQVSSFLTISVHKRVRQEARWHRVVSDKAIRQRGTKGVGVLQKTTA